jgi:soluble lytic murein transglycosylase
VSSHAARIARRPSRARLRRRRLSALLVAAVLGGGVAAFVTGVGPLGDAVREFTLPLRHDDIIRQQASDKALDPALIAAVIYEESRFRDQTSHAGARGLMQITPETADFIARRSGGIRFEQSDLATPQINIAYGAWFLRYLIDHYDGNETLAIAAYNAGQTNVDGWVERAGGPEGFDAARDVPFPETRAYVENVEERRGEYRDHYADDLGL